MPDSRLVRFDSGSLSSSFCCNESSNAGLHKPSPPAQKYSSVSFVQCMDYPGKHNTVCTTQPVISTVGISVRCFLEKKGKASEPSKTVI